MAHADLGRMEDSVSASLYQLGAMDLVGKVQRTITDDRGFRTLHWTEEGYWTGLTQQSTDAERNFTSSLMSTMPGQPLSQVFQRVQNTASDNVLVSNYLQPYVEQRCGTKVVSSDKVLLNNLTESVWFGNDSSDINSLVTAGDLMHVWQTAPTASSKRAELQGLFRVRPSVHWFDVNKRRRSVEHDVLRSGSSRPE